MPTELPPTTDPDPRDAGTLAELVAPAVEAAGMHFEGATVSGEPGQRTVTVVVDRAEGTEGLDLDEVAAAAEAVSAALDAAGDDLPGLGAEPYQLEVTTPGVSRPLTEPRHWQRNVGRLVTVTLTGEAGSGAASTEGSAADPGQEITARIQQADGAGVVLVPIRPGAKKGMPAKVGQPERHGYDRLGPGRVQVELSSGGSAGPREELDTEV